MTRGFILAEIVRRTDPSGRSLQVFFDEEVSHIFIRCASLTSSFTGFETVEC